MSKCRLHRHQGQWFRCSLPAPPVATGSPQWAQWNTPRSAARKPVLCRCFVLFKHPLVPDGHADMARRCARLCEIDASGRQSDVRAGPVRPRTEGSGRPGQRHSLDSYDASG
jgi:hypothetical protein